MYIFIIVLLHCFLIQYCRCHITCNHSSQRTEIQQTGKHTVNRDHNYKLHQSSRHDCIKIISSKNGVIGGLVGVLIAAAVILISYLSNDTIKTQEDVERYLKLSTLGTIPMSEEDRKNKKKKKQKKQKRGRGRR